MHDELSGVAISFGPRSTKSTANSALKAAHRIGVSMVGHGNHGQIPVLVIIQSMAVGGVKRVGSRPNTVV